MPSVDYNLLQVWMFFYSLDLGSVSPCLPLLSVHLDCSHISQNSCDPHWHWSVLVFPWLSHSLSMQRWTAKTLILHDVVWWAIYMRLTLNLSTTFYMISWLVKKDEMFRHLYVNFCLLSLIRMWQAVPRPASVQSGFISTLSSVSVPCVSSLPCLTLIGGWSHQPCLIGWLWWLIHGEGGWLDSANLSEL